MFIRPKIEVLHLASFAGNIGDIANHKSFRRWFELLFSDYNVSWNNFEMRRFFRQELNVLNKFESKVSDCDLLIIGGGNFLELWPENTPSGTSLPFSTQYLEQTNKPVFINSIGVDDGQGISQSASLNFKVLANFLASSERVFLTVRNDGSMRTISRFLDTENYARCMKLPDHGFFLDKIENAPRKKEHVLGINLAIDMPEFRFANNNNSPNQFLSEFANTLNSVAKENPHLKFKFIPHMYSDIEAYAVILRNLKDELRRERVTISTYNTSWNSKTISESYSGLSMLVAMRFHANVFGISQNIPTFSIVSYPQIEKMINEMAIEKWPQYNLHWNQSLLHQNLSEFIKRRQESGTYHMEKQIVTFLERLSDERTQTGLELRKWLCRLINKK
jgi:polysaccharide pyruvyl transferase WcaK-like protein